MRKALAVAVGLLFGLAAIASCGGGSKFSAKNAEFTKLYEKSKTARVRVTYDEHGTGRSSTWIVSQDGARRSAFIEQDAKTVVSGGSVTSCTNLSSAPDCTTTKLDANAPQTAAGFANEFFLQVEGFREQSKSHTGDSVVGRAVRCASAVDTIDGTNATFEGCLDEATGFLLRATIAAGKDAKTELIATRVEDPRDDDFLTPSTTTTVDESSSSTSRPTIGTTPTSGGDSTVTTAIGCAVTMTLPPISATPPPPTTPCTEAGG